MGGWIGVDLDGTLAEYHGYNKHKPIGDPIPTMLERIRGWLAEGKTVKIVTARVAAKYLYPDDANALEDALLWESRIHAYTEEHLGQRLEVTAVKDYSMIELWDDRAVQVIPNSGMTVLEYYTEGRQ